jgi:hypothetical protein
MMSLETITELLSCHRNHSNVVFPAALTRQQIMNLSRSNLIPNQSLDKFQDDLKSALEELQAQGEILIGVGNRYCMAPPTVLAEDEEKLTSLLFRGDRYYLSLAHQCLKTKQADQETKIRPQVRGFHRIRENLEQVGIRFLTVDDSLGNLPHPCKPSIDFSRSSWIEIDILNLPDTVIRQYVPKQDTNQCDRWVSLPREQVKNQIHNEEILKLSTGEYLWSINDQFYKIPPDVALLAMFQKDKDAGSLLKLQWDELQGRLNLSGVFLPSPYIHSLWRLSEPDETNYRIRYIAPANRPSVKTALKRLGCLFV